MKIRNLQQYVARKCHQSEEQTIQNLSLIGTNDEPFFKEGNGSEKDLRILIEDYTSVANNAEQQVFYEFVQNAFDAHATQLMFFMGTVEQQDYLLVMNNGRPFYTVDPTIPRDTRGGGQLLEFLFKNVSNHEEGDLGHFGQGSKLLYTLMVDKRKGYGDEDLIVHTIIDEKKAPYLLSWSDGIQLDNFLVDRGVWDRSLGYDNNEMIIAKLLCSYYPLEPGVDETLFSASEVTRLTKVFQTLVDPERNMMQFGKQGTALIIPLGLGKKEIIESEQNACKVRRCLAPVSEILTGYKKGRHLDRILFLGRDIPTIHTDRIVTEVEREDLKNPGHNKSFLYQFVFDPSFAEQDAVNLFHVLPIPDSTYGLGFIIDSLDLSVKADRQGISRTDKAIENITEAMHLFVGKFEEMKTSDPAQYERIYRQLLLARPHHEVVKTPFDEVIVPYLTQNVLTCDGTYRPLAEVRKLESSLSISIRNLGIESYSLVDKTIYEQYQQILKDSGRQIDSTSLASLLAYADNPRLEAWVRQLSEADYDQLQSEVLACKDSIKDKPLFLSNYGHVYKYTDIMSTEKHIFTPDYAPEAFSIWPEAECIIKAFGRYEPKPDTIARKLLYAQDTYFEDQTACEFACCLLDNIWSKLSDSQKGDMREKFRVFRNLQNERSAMRDLFIEAPANSSIFNTFCLKGAKPLHYRPDWFVQKSEQWAWVHRNLESLKALPDWNEYAEYYLKDLLDAAKNQTILPKKPVELYLDKEGRPHNESYCKLNIPTSCVSSQEYDQLTQLFPEYSFVPYRFWDLLSNAYFSLGKVELKEAIGSGKTVDSMLLSILCRVDKNHFLRNYKVENNEEDKYVVSPLCTNERNYFIADGILKQEALDMLTEAGFLRLPNELCNLFPDTKPITEDAETTMQTFRCCTDCSLLLPLLNRCNTDSVRTTFYQHLPELAFTTGSSVNPFHWDVVTWTVRYAEQKTSDVWKKITINGEHLCQDLCANKVKVMKEDNTVSKEYDAYLLMPNLGTDDQKVLDLLRLVPDRDWFDQEYCAEHRRSLSASDMAAMLPTSLNIVQMEFALDYLINEKGTIRNTLSLNTDTPWISVLDVVLRREFHHFHKYFNVPGFNIEQQSFAEPRVLLPEEQLPSELYSWINRVDTEKALCLFEGKLNYKHPLLTFRQKMLSGEPSTMPNLEKVSDGLLNRTYKWLELRISEHTISLKGDSTLVRNIKSLQEHLTKGAKMGLLRIQDTNTEFEEIGFTLAFPDASNLRFLEISNSEKHLLDMLSDPNHELHKLLCRYQICLPLSDELMNRHGLANNPRWKIKTEAKKDADWQEWKDDTYHKWLLTGESKNIHIFHTNNKIKKSVSILDENEKTLCENNLGAEDQYGRFEMDGYKCVVVEARPERPEVLKGLVNASSKRDMDFFRTPFISLQSMMLEELMKKDEAIRMGHGDDEPGEGVRISAKKAELVKDISIEQLQLLRDGKLTLGGNGGNGGNGNGQKEKEEKEEEAKENNISGYIGELLYNGYMNDKKLTNFIWAASQGVRAYDFKVGDEYVDIKTNVYTLKDGKAAFYLHKSQHEFLTNDPNVPYFICRISLNDLGLKSEYDVLRKEYGEADPRKDEILQQKCKHIAETFWNSTNALSLFESARHIYKIKSKEETFIAADI